MCPCRSVLDRRCPLGSNCYGQRLAAGYYYDKDGNPNIRICYTVPGAERATLQSDISARAQSRFRSTKVRSRRSAVDASPPSPPFRLKKNSYALTE